LSETLDFMIVEPFQGYEAMFEGKKPEKSLHLWNEYVNNRQANLVFIRRFNISAPLTILFSHFSPQPFAASKMMYCVRDVSDSDAKILALWFNSTLNVLQVLLERIETGGAYIGLSKYSLLDSYILNPSKLSREQKDSILNLYERIKAVEFPSLLKQLENRFPARVEIDKLMLGVLGFGGDEINRLLDYLYPVLANEIQQLKTLMQG
jgi:hypothetical protein